VPDEHNGTIARMSDAEWLANQQRPEDMVIAAAKYRADGWTAEDDVCKPFVKSEWHLDAKEQGDGTERRTELKPRGIYTLSDKGHVIVGPYTLPALHRMGEIWGPQSVIEYAGCKTPKEMRDLLRRLERMAAQGFQFVDNDYSCFETSHSPHSFQTYRNLLRRLWADYCQLREEIMTKWESPEFQAKIGGFVFKGKLPTMMCSGRPDTALGNAIKNGLATFFAIVAAVAGLNVAQLDAVPDAVWAWATDNVKVVVVGDDSIIAIRLPEGQTLPAVLQRVEQNICRLGFISKLEPRKHLRELVFLGNRPYLIGEHYEWGPSLGRRLYKHHWGLDVTGDPKAWMAQVADMERRTCGHVPLIKEFAEAAAREYGKARPMTKGMQRRMAAQEKYSAQQYILEGLSYGPETLADMAQLYNVDVALIEDCVKKAREITQVPCAFSHPFIEVVMAADAE
jgi:hypothetical protein